MAYTIIPSTSIDADSLADVALMTALRDNPLYTNDYQQFTANGTWTKPSWVTPNMIIEVEVWGGGGGGNAGGGGGGGAYNCRRFLASSLSATESVVVAGTAAVGAVGNTSSFGTLMYAYGGGNGVSGLQAPGGGGTRGAGSNTAAGLGYATAEGTGDVGGPAQASGNGYGAFWGGGGGSAGVGTTGGRSTFGGGGGGVTAGGASLYGGAGGAGTGAGTAPGGGGGSNNSTTGGTGARGEVRVRVLA